MYLQPTIGPAAYCLDRMEITLSQCTSTKPYCLACPGIWIRVLRSSAHSSFIRSKQNQRHGITRVADLTTQKRRVLSKCKRLECSYAAVPTNTLRSKKKKRAIHHESLMHKNKKPLFANSTSLSKSRPSCVVHMVGPEVGGIPILNAISNAAFRLFSFVILLGSEWPVNMIKAVRGGKAS